MAVVPENTCLPQAKAVGVAGSGVRSLKPAVAEAAPGELADPDLQQQYSQLQERFSRTTHALASAAHDLKTPLAILNGYVELLQSEKLGPLSERQQEVLQDMRSSGKRLQQFIQDFLSFSLLEIGQMKMHYEP